MVFHEMVQTPPDGEGLFEVPGEIIRPGRRLKVQALGDERRESANIAEQQVAQQVEQDGRIDESLAANVVDTYLPVSPSQPLTYYVFDKPVAGEGEELRVYGLAIDPFTGEPQSAPLGEIDVKEGETTRRMQLAWSVNPENNLAEGTIRSFGLSDGVERSFRKVEQQQDELSKQAQREEVQLSLLKIESAKDGADASRYARAQLESLDKGNVALRGMNPDALRSRAGAGAASAEGATFAPLAEEGALAPSAPGFSAAGAAPPAAAGVDKIADSKALTEGDKSVAARPEPAKEAGEKAAGQLAHGRATEFETQDAARQAASTATGLASDSSKQKRQQIESGKPLEVEVPVEQSGKRLDVVVMARDVPVLRQKVQIQVERSMTAGKQMEERAKIALDVPPEVDGNLEMLLIDQAAKAVVLKRELYRVPVRGLSIKALNQKARYEPGELVQLRLKVVNEQGAPATKTALAARVWNEDYVPDDRSQIAMLEDSLRRWERFDGLADQGELLAQGGRSGEAFGAAMALGGAGAAASAAELPGNKPPDNQLFRSDRRESGVALKKAQVPAAGSPPEAAPALASTTPPPPAVAATPEQPTPEQPTPEPPAPAAALPAGSAQFAQSSIQAVDSLQTAEAESKIDAAGTGASTYSLSELGYGYLVSGDLPPLTASNELAVRQQLDSLKSEDQRALAAWRLMFGRVLIGGGLVALAILGVLFLMQQEVRWSSGTLALVASAACLVIGAFWSTGGRQDRMVASAYGSHSAGGDSADYANVALDQATPAPAEVMAKSASPAVANPAPADSVQELAPADNEASPAPLPPKDAAGSPDTIGLTPGAAPFAAPAPASPEGRGEGGADPATKYEPPRAMKLGADDMPASRAARPPVGGSGGGLGGFGGGEARGGADRRANGRSSGEPAGVSLGSGRGGKAGGQSLGTQPPGAPGAAAAGPAPGAPDTASAQLVAPATPPRPAEARPPKPSSEPAAPAPTASAPTPPTPASGDRPSAPRRAAQPGTFADQDNVSDRDKGADRDAAATTPAPVPPAGAPASDASTGAPSAIYFNPQLITAADGTVTIEFRMPQVPSAYRVLLDAYGNGRVGSSAELRILCEPSK
jgi:hypothetical protein